MKLIVVPVALVCFLMGCQSAAEQPAEQPESAAPDGESRFTFSEDATSLTILDSGEPVLTFLHGRTDPPDGVDQSWWRSNYIHPIYGLDGEILTQDFPADHLHHRGLFWTWPDVTKGDLEVDPWALIGARQLFLDWEERRADGDRATVSFMGGWRLDEAWEPFVEEQITLTIHPADEVGRSLDLQMQFTNVSSETVTLRGRGETGYGGFNIRPDGDRPGIRITTAEGLMEDDALVVESGWADYSALFRAEPEEVLSAPSGEGGSGAEGDDSDAEGDASGSDETGQERAEESGAYSGIAIFQHPSNPGFPHPGWILRYYGFIGASWPQYERLELAPGEGFSLAYRVYIHRGDAEAGEVEERYNAFLEEMQ